MNTIPPTNNILVLASDAQTYFANSAPHITPLYRHANASFLQRVCRKLALTVGVGAGHFLGDWYQTCQSVHTIIVFDTGNAPLLLALLKKMFPHIRLILWYWNPIACSIPLHRINRAQYEIWSYHRDDCARYQLRHNTQFYIAPPQSLLHHGSTLPLAQDLYFVGADKNRAQILSEMLVSFAQFGLSYNTILTKTQGSVAHKIAYSAPISPTENLQNILQSKVLIDIVPTTHLSGHSLRVLEAQIHHKKLLTTDIHVKQLPFYSPKNVFIWGVDNPTDLPDFVNTPFCTADAPLACFESGIAFYEFEKWLHRFFEDI